MTRKRLNNRKFDREQGQWHSVDQQTIQELSSTRRHQECLQACQQLLQNEAENPLPWKYAGKSLLALGQFEKAHQCFSKAHQLDTKDPETTKDIGNIFLKLRRPEDAIEWYKKSLRINNNYAPAINNIANIKRQSGNNQEAVNLFKQAIQADPQFVQAYAGAAASSLALGDLDQAESFAIRAIEINAHARGINEMLGIIFQNKKKFRQAVESYQKELDINPKSNTSLLNLGFLLLQQGEAAAAIEPLERAAVINTSEQCSLLLAQAYQNIGKLKEAIIEYKKIDITQSQNKMIPFNLGLCLLNTGSNTDAIEAFKIAIKLDESFLLAWGNIGTAFINESRHQEALPVTQKVVELDPNNPNAHMNLGGIYKELGNLDQALTSTLKSLELNPDNPTAHMNLGIIYKDLGKLDQALTSTLKSLELNPDDPNAQMNLGKIYKDLGQLDQALAATLKSLKLNPDDPNAHTNLGIIYKDLGNLDQALTSTLKSLELNPDDPNAQMNLGGIYQNLGNLDQALASTLKSLELKPDNPTAHMNLGGIYKDLGNLDQALASTLKSLELKPDNPEAVTNLGGIYKDLGNLEQALASTLKSLELKPDNPTAHMNLGGIYKDLGNLDMALASTFKSLELKPDNPTAHMNLGGIYKDLGNLDMALASTFKSLELKPDNLTAHMNLGRIYKELGNDDLALSSYKKACDIDPNIKTKCLSRLQIPAALTNTGEIQQACERYISNLAEIFKEHGSKGKREFVDLSLFRFTYLNLKHERNFMESIASIVHPWLSLEIINRSTESSNNKIPQKKRDPQKPPRIGFYFDNTHPGHVVFKHFYNIVKSCKASKMEIVLLKGPLAAAQDSKDLEKQSSQVFQLSNNLENSVKSMKELSLDVLIYTETHSSSVPYCLMHNRIAPTQMVLPGNELTTGLKTIDYFVSSKYTETSNSDNYYTEKLIKLDGMPSGFDEIIAPRKEYDRNYFDIPMNCGIVNLMHNAIKFHPDWDDILEQIAQSCENILFIISSNKSKDECKLLERLERTAPTFIAKSKFFERMAKAKYLGLLNCSDVMLDPLYRGCGTTAFDALGVGLPIVTMPGMHSRSRLVYGLYRIMDIKNPPIASSASEYINWCTKIIGNKDNSNRFKEDILVRYKKIIKQNKKSISEIASLINDLALCE